MCLFSKATKGVKVSQKLSSEFRLGQLELTPLPSTRWQHRLETQLISAGLSIGRKTEFFWRGGLKSFAWELAPSPKSDSRSAPAGTNIFILFSVIHFKQLWAPCCFAVLCMGCSQHLGSALRNNTFLCSKRWFILARARMQSTGTCIVILACCKESDCTSHFESASARTSMH